VVVSCDLIKIEKLGLKARRSLMLLLADNIKLTIF